MKIRVALGCVFLLALAVRALGFEWVFVGGDTVVFSPGDAQYHVRLATYAWTNFPSVLVTDPYLNYPGGATVPWPPLFDFIVAGVARLLTLDATTFHMIAAWAPPLFGALTLLPVFAVARRLGGPAIGLGAATLLALLPMSINYSRVGQFDHHCAVGLLGACLLLVVARLAEGEGSSRWLAVGLAAGRIAMLLTWPGSLLYLALVEGTLWCAAAFTGRRDLYRVQAVSALATWIVVSPVVWILPEPAGGAYSAIALSWLHPLALAAVALVSTGLWWLEGRASSRSAKQRLTSTIALGLIVVAGFALLPGPREGMELALRFMTMSDGVGSRTGEQLPLFGFLGRAPGRPVTDVWGFLGYAIPVLPFAVLWATPPEKRAVGWVVAAWCAWFGVLAVLQRRYGNEFAPAAAVGFAVVIAALGRRVVSVYGGGRGVVACVQILLAVFALSPTLLGQTLPKAVSGLRALQGGYDDHDRALLTVAGTLTRFLEQVRELTPETSGYFDNRGEPEYGVAAHPNFGHAIHNVARRPTGADPFGAYISPENWATVSALLGARNEANAAELARQLDARYVMTFSSARPETLEGWLQHADGRGTGPWGASEHFRLVTEGPAGGAHFAQVFQVQGRRMTGQGASPYKLFEFVEGAVLEVPAAPGDEVTASLRLRRPQGGDFPFEWKAVAADDGLARLRVPYPTGPAEHAQAVGSLGPYRVRVGLETRALTVTEEAVRSGATVRD